MEGLDTPATPTGHNGRLVLELDSFRWSSRPKVATLLIGALRASPPAKTRSKRRLFRGPDREQVASLLRILATQAEVEDLLAILTDPQEEHWVRVYALRALVRLRHPPEERDLQTLLNEGLLSLGDTRDQPTLGGSSARATIGLQEWGQWVTRAESTSFLMRDLEERTPAERADLLFAVAQHETPLADALYARWVRSDRSSLADTERGDATNLKLAQRTAERVESRAWLRERWWLASPSEQRSIKDTLLYQEAWNLRRSRDPETWRKAAQALALPLEDLLAEFGARALEARLAEALSQVNDALRRRVVRHSWQAPGWEAVDLLGAWEQGADLVVDWLNRRDTVPELRRHLLDALWRQSLARTRAWALEQLQSSDPERAATGVPLIGRVLVRICQDPAAEDRPLLKWALGRGEAGFRALALEGLETLGEDGEEWEATLGALSRAQDWRVALRATGALVARGDAAEESHLVERARHSDDPEEVAEAIRILGRFALDRHRALFAEFVTKDPRNLCSPDQYHAPAAEEAAYALQRIGDPAALTALVQGHLRIPGNAEQVAFETYLAFLTQAEGDPPTPFQRVWRGSPRRYFSWLPKGVASDF